MSDVIVQYSGFTPPETLRESLDKMIREVIESAPSNAVVKATICLADQCFKGTIRINSRIGGFFAIATDTKLRVVGNKLVHQINRQLNRWKSTRFQEPVTKGNENERAAW